MAHAEDLTQNVLAVLHDKYPQVAELVELVFLGFQTSINTIYTWDFRCRKQLLALMGGCRE